MPTPVRKWRPLAFPRMRRRLLIPVLLALALVAAACGSDDDSADSDATTSSSEAPTGTDASTTTAEDGDGEAAFAVTNVVFGDDGFVEVTNIGGTTATPEGLVLCQRPNYPDVPDDELEPGQSVRIEASELGGLSADSGEVALYDGRNFTDPDSILTYVQWGEADHGRTSVAIEAGIWPDGEFIDVSADSTEISTDSSDPTNPSDWAVG